MYCLCLPLPAAFFLVICLAGCLLFLPLRPAPQPLLSLSPRMVALKRVESWIGSSWAVPRRSATLHPPITGLLLNSNSIAIC